MNIRVRKAVAIASLLLLAGCSETQITDVQHYEKAERYYESSDLYSSVIELKNALQKNSEFYDARFLLGDIYLKVGAGESAEKEFLYAEKIGGKSYFLTYKVAQALFEQRKYEEVVELEPMLVEPSGDESQMAKAYALLAQCYIELDDIDKARKYVDISSEYNSHLIETGLANVRILAAEGRYEKSRQEQDALVKLYPSESSVWSQRANLAFSRGEFSEAENAFKEVVRLEPIRPLTRKVFNSKIGLVRTYMLNNKAGQAKPFVDELLKLKSKHPAVLYLSASVAYHQKNMDAALTPLLEVAEMAPNYFPAVMLLGAVHFAKGSYEQANIELARYLNEHPDNVVARKLFAATSMKLNKPEAVIQALEPVLTKGDTDVELLVMAGRASFQIGDNQSALQYIKSAKLMAPDSVGVSSELAKAYLDQGEYQHAIEELKSIKAEGQEQAKVAMVVVHLQGRDFTNARLVATELVNAHPEQSDYLVLLGGVELVAGEQLKARGYFENAAIKSPDSVPALINLARLDMQNEKFSASKKGYERVLGIDPKNVNAMFALAQLAEQKGDLKEGAEWLEKIRQVDSQSLLPRLVLGRYYLNAGRLNEAMEIAEEAKKYHLEAPSLLLLLSKIYNAMENYDSALLINRQLVDVLPEAPGAYFELAKTETKLFQFESAKENLEKSLKLKPDYISAKTLLATVYLKLEDYDSALKLAKDVQKSFPDLALGYQLSGVAYKEKGALKEAEKNIRKALAISPSGKLVLILAQIYLDQGEIGDAEQVLLTRLENEAKDIEAMFKLALLYQESSSLTKAERYYLQVIDHDPSNVKALNNLAMLFLEKNEPYSALDYAKRVYRLDSGNVFVKDTYGWVLVLTDRLDEGRELIEDAASMTEHPSVQYHYGYVLSKQGETDKSRRVLGRLLDRAGDFPELDDARKLYESL